MNHKECFTARKNFRGLEDAVNAILEDSNNDVEYDLTIIPPQPSVVSDEEEDFIENRVEGLPNEVPGEIELFIRNIEDILVSDCSSDDEPLAAKRTRLRTNTAQYDGNSVANKHRTSIASVWRKCVPIYSKTYLESDNLTQNKNRMNEAIKDLTPVEIFEQFFDEEVMNMIVNYSMMYASQNNRHNFSLTVAELKVFLGILILSGYHKVPREKMYWSLDEDIKVEVVSKAMSRNRFQEIKRNLHLVDNNEAEKTTDKMFKVRKLSDILIKKFNQWNVFHENISVDESMVKYFGHHSSKQFIRGKPVRFGYKNWVAASSCGYCYAFDIYCGKTSEMSNEPLGSKVVKMLLKKLDTNPANHRVFFDNFFTSCDLLRDLRELGYRATGTIRDNRTKKCPLPTVKEMRKMSRAEFDYRFDKSNEILLVRWKDNSICTMATNYDSFDPLGTVRRWNSEKKQKMEMKIPLLFQNYNKGMGGVDEMDQSISLYRVGIHGKKWWWVLFTYMIDMAISNAWRIHVASRDNSMDQLLFRRNIARYYLSQVSQKHIARPSSSNVEGLHLDGFDHVPEKLPNRVRCVICHNRCRWGCKKCKKTLCIEKSCFEKFHT